MSQSPVTHLDLQKLSGGRVLQHLAIGGLFGIGLFVAVSGIYGLSEDTNGSEWVLAFGLLLILLAELLRRANLNQIRPGAIVVADSKLRITYPPLLRGPLELDLDDVSVAAIAADNAEPSFPVYADGQRTAKITNELPAGADWLPVRSLVPDDATANTILLFEGPVAPPGLRRIASHGRRLSEPLGGIAVNVADRGHAHRMFGAAGIRSRINEQDLERLARINAGEAPIEPEAGA